MARTTFSGPVKSDNGFIVGTGGTITKVLSASVSLDFPQIAAGSQENIEVDFAGASIGNAVLLALPSSPTNGLVFNAFVSGANTVSVRAFNITGSPIDQPARTFGIIVVAVS